MKFRFTTLFTVFVALLAASVSADTFKIDPVHSQVVFQVGHLGVSKIFGRFDTVDGTFSTDDDAAKVSFDARVAVDSVDTGNTTRDKHLKTPDFFNAKQFPEITFKSTGVKQSGDNYEVTGDLTLHGVTKSITITLTKIGQAKTQMGERAGFDTQFTINRADYGMTSMSGAVGDEIGIWINLEGVKE